MGDASFSVKTLDPDFEIIEFEDIMCSFPPEDKCGLRVTSGSVTLYKEKNSLIGISIGGGVPYCPCIYIVQIFDNTVAARDGSLEAGDEITAIDRKSVRGVGRGEVAKWIQKSEKQVTIFYNKLHVDKNHGRSVDMVFKRFKHRIVENIDASTADFLGLSRAILVNDSLMKRLDLLNQTSHLFEDLSNFISRFNEAGRETATIHKKMADVFDAIGVKEPQPNASEAFKTFAKGQRCMHKYFDSTFCEINKIVEDLKIFLKKVIPDTKLTIKKYLNAKFEYLSYCLKVKEMDDEESCFIAMNEALYRIETGNYDYRLLLRCRQDSRKHFSKKRNDVLEKVELLDNKHVQDIVKHLGRFMNILKEYYSNNYSAWKSAQIFPIEIDISSLTHINEDFNERLGNMYKKNNLDDDDDADDDDDDDELINPKENDFTHSILKSMDFP